MRVSVYAIFVSMISACGSLSPIEADWSSEETETDGENAEENIFRDIGENDEGSCSYPLQGSQCDPWDTLACPDGNCVLHGGPVIVWACEMGQLARPNGAPCLFNGDCDSGICIPLQYHPSPDDDAIVGACGVPCLTKDDCAENSVCQPSIEDIAGVQVFICLNI